MEGSGGCCKGRRRSKGQSLLNPPATVKSDTRKLCGFLMSRNENGAKVTDRQKKICYRLYTDSDRLEISFSQNVIVSF